MSSETNDISGLRAALFETLRGVRAGTVDLEKAKAVNELGKTIIETARVEVDYLKASGGGESAFLDTAVGQGNLPPGITGITRHRLQG